MRKCDKCGQTISEFSKETLEKFDRMCKIWISLLMKPTKELISTEQFNRLFPQGV